eukprot:CAMPEP_0113725752 /NCGR_PEP_ID=MMETSP0038_2-20120614/39966_1 /TAXON_ID=2898 /ORGANISM="Cryptomonas paramecium" /LENGTH=93 /DNA_ID=CAMNT_0000656113 /DNA_START=432 /DNA_END=710 /DNA_ORIENTATION=+ /assembly_acc=CAM_ASM_000170
MESLGATSARQASCTKAELGAVSIRPLPALLRRAERLKEPTRFCLGSVGVLAAMEREEVLDLISSSALAGFTIFFPDRGFLTGFISFPTLADF